MASIVWIKDVSKADAKALVKWWNANTDYYYFPRKPDTGKMWSVVRQTK